MGIDPSLGEETQGFAGVGGLADAEDLDVHGAGIYMSYGPMEPRRSGSAANREIVVGPGATDGVLMAR